MDPSVGHLNGILARVGGNLNNNFQKSQMPGGLPGGGMLKLRFDRYITLFRNGNNPGKPFCTALLSFAPAYLGYHRYVHNHIRVLANDPLLYS